MFLVDINTDETSDDECVSFGVLLEMPQCSIFALVTNGADWIDDVYIHNLHLKCIYRPAWCCILRD